MNNQTNVPHEPASSPRARVLSPAFAALTWRRFLLAHSPEIRPALRVGFGLAIPGAILMLIGHTDLMVYAVFGSVVGMYGRSQHRLQRLKDQLLAGAMMLCAGVSGIILAPWGLDGWALVAGGIFWASASSLTADRYGLKPGGSFFPVFAFGALASLPVEQAPSLGGLAAFTLTALIGVILGQTARFGSTAQDPFGHDPIPWPDALRRATCYACVVLLAGALGIGLQFDHLQWVIAGSVVPLAAGNARGRLSRGVHRVAGTVAGLVVLLGIYYLQLPDLALALAIILLMFPTEGYMTRNYGLALSFFTPLIMLMLELADPSVNAEVLWERALGNLLGVLAGILGALIFDRKPR
ncbi:FUSC family protein [Glutamicibacter sp. NPDC087344]|uniref:FUSC family protein n=1 Tax=Glutamicibacter sp. NPDC087344 TaxID=3363994 RepID=UPI00380CE591